MNIESDIDLGALAVAAVEQPPPPCEVPTPCPHREECRMQRHACRAFWQYATPEREHLQPAERPVDGALTSRLWFRLSFPADEEEEKTLRRVYRLLSPTARTLEKFHHESA